MQSVADFMVRGMGLTVPPEWEKLIHRGLRTSCAITGAPISEGILWSDVIPGSTGEYLDLLHGMARPYVGVAAALAFKSGWNLGGRMFFEDGAHYHPLISAANAAADGRPCWSDLVRQVWPERAGQCVVTIISDDYKKRVWPRAMVGVLGPNTPVFLFDSGRSIQRNVAVNWAGFLDVLDLAEDVYEWFGEVWSRRAGEKGRQPGGLRRAFRRAMLEGMRTDYAVMSADSSRACGYEAGLSKRRGSPEFDAAVLIAQRRDQLCPQNVGEEED